MGKSEDYDDWDDEEDDFDPPPQIPSRRGNGHEDLDILEDRLTTDVDEDFFEDPKKFHTLHRVIDVLGAQVEEPAAMHVQAGMSDYDNLRKNNPAYRALKKQEKVVEDAIEHMAVRHCADLNSSVVQVGKVARQFSDAVSMVRHLRRQVRDIKETLGSSSTAGMGSGDTKGASAAQAAAMSLRELWLKKLECEAVLALLTKIDVVRAAPQKFDALIKPPGPIRIGAATMILSKATYIGLRTNVSEVHALQHITMKLMERSQRADHIIWDTLYDVLYLRTGNGVVATPAEKKAVATENKIPSSGASVASDSRSFVQNGMKNPFMSRTRRPGIGDDESVDTTGSGASLFSRDDAPKTEVEVIKKKTKMMIPVSLLEADLDLENDEMRCLEEMAGSSWDDAHTRSLPRYTDHVLALRILLECLTKLNRLDDVERTLNENIEREIRKLTQKEQAKTFSRLEKQQQPRRGRSQNLKDFRRHLTGLLSSYGCVMIRVAHLAQIFRYRIATEKDLQLHSIGNKTTALHSVLINAYDCMQREIKNFLKGTLIEEEDTGQQGNHSHQERHNIANHSQERGLFSLGITEASTKKDAMAMTSARVSNTDKSGHEFVADVLMPKTNTTPQVRHALEFRRSLAKWTSETEELRDELAAISGEDMSSPSYGRFSEEGALHYLDGVIKRQLIPVLQHDAINGTTQALEREDAFDPVIDRTLYGRPNSNEPQDVDMCIACQALYHSTGPLFSALHRLPKDEKMYLHLVGVLEHAILTFISRVKPRVGQLCNDKTALRLLLDSGKDGKEKSFGTVIEKRKAFAQLLHAYADGDALEASQIDDGFDKDPSSAPLNPSLNEAKSRNGGGDHKSGADDLDLMGSVDKEEQILIQELTHLASILDFTKDDRSNSVVCCSDEELMKASCLSHSLLKLSSLLESRLKVRHSGAFEKTLTSTRALREAIKTIKAHGVKVAKFCRIDMLMQNVTRLSKICKSSTIVAKDAVRIPTCVNDLGEYLTGASDNLREAGGNAVTGYTFSSLEQYIPLFLMQTVRVIASGDGIVSKSPLTLNGVEALDRSGSVLYRDLKGATSFDHSFWDDELAAISFERSASFMAMMEVEMEELEAFYRGNHEEFSDKDFQLMFGMNGPRRRGDVGRYHILKKKMNIA